MKKNKIMILILILLLISLNIFSIEIVNEDCSIESNNFKITGTLSYPKINIDNKKLPLFIMFHGSGPIDRYGTIQTGITPYLELSKNLAEKGYCFFSYDKRSFIYFKDNQVDNLNKITIQDEINDLINSIIFLKNKSIVDSNNIFIIGHSQGAGLIPEVLKKIEVKGVILLSPNLLRIDEQVKYQLKYQIDFFKKENKNGSMDSIINQLSSILNQCEIEFKTINNLDGNKIMGFFTKPYFLDWMDKTTNQVEKIKTIQVPSLLINGDKDLKTPVDLLNNNLNLLKTNKNLKIIIMKNMTHELYIYKTLNFNYEVIKEIDNWVKTLL